jgi:uncharacterized protein (TIGR02646 family)
MIQIRRLPVPADWLAMKPELIQRFKGDPADWITHAGRALLQVSLSTLSHHKCSYCESELVGGLEIEHYHHKSRSAHLAFDWDNLFASCGKCNRTKSSFPHSGILLKPDVDDGEQFFYFEPADGRLSPHPTLATADHRRAEQTIRRHDLNRSGLCSARRRMFITVQRFLQSIEHLLTPVLKLEFVELLAPAKPYKLAIRSALPPRLADVDRRMYHNAAD